MVGTQNTPIHRDAGPIFQEQNDLAPPALLVVIREKCRFRGELSHASPVAADRLREEALKAIASHRVGNRPDRIEPRVRKRRPKAYPLMHETREKARKRLKRAA